MRLNQNFAGATLANSGTLVKRLYHNALWTRTTPADLFNIGGSISSDAESTINNSGRLVNLFGSLTNAGAFNNSGFVQNDFGSSLSNSGTFNNSGFVGNFAASSFSNSGTFNNSGEISNDSGSVFGNSGTLNNSGTISNSLGGMLVNSGTLNNAGTINNSASFSNSGAVTITNTGVFNTTTNYNQSGGSTVVNGVLNANSGAIVNIQGGSLSGGGTVNGNVVMAGNMIAGTPGNPMTFNINGNYTQNATGIFTALIGSAANSLLNVSGTATLVPARS